MDAEHDEQQKKLQDRLAKRRRRRGALARQECELKQEQATEAAKLDQAHEEAAAALDSETRSASFEEVLQDLINNTPEDELPAAVLKAVENKHQDELEDLLMKLYKQRAEELKAQVLALLEEKVQARGVVDKDFQARKEALEAFIEGVTEAAGGRVDESAEK